MNNKEGLGYWSERAKHLPVIGWFWSIMLKALQINSNNGQKNRS